MNTVGPPAPASITPRSTACFMGRRRSERGDLPEQLDIVTPVPELRLDVAPAQDALLVDEEIGALREEAILEQHPVGPAHVAPEVTHHILPPLVLPFLPLAPPPPAHPDRHPA